MFNYFISYQYTENLKNKYGFGNCEYPTTKKINDLERIRMIEKEIEFEMKKNRQFAKVIILNYILLNERKKKNG